MNKIKEKESEIVTIKIKYKGWLGYYLETCPVCGCKITFVSDDDYLENDKFAHEHCRNYLYLTSIYYLEEIFDRYITGYDNGRKKSNFTYDISKIRRRKTPRYKWRD
jgi:hypothetical protein